MGKQNSIRKIARTMLIVLVVCLCALLAMFYSLLRQYRQNSAYSSASHLVEINRQGKVNIQAFLQRDRSVALELAHEIEIGDAGTPEKLFASMEFYQTTWGEDDIYVYTENGQCLNRRGIVQSSGSASRAASATVQDGSRFSVVRAQTEYSVAVDTAMQLQGSRIVAVSVVHRLDRLISDMGLESFEGKGTTYLTRQNGVRICQSDNADAATVYNLLSVFDAGTLTDLTGSGASISENMASGTEGAFLFRSASGLVQYVVLTPVDFSGETLYLFTIVPQSIVNATMNQYSRDVMLLSVGVMLLTVLLFISFFQLFLRKSRRYDADLRSRERLFDLLSGETRNAFFLLEEDQPRPEYASSNLTEILGEDVRQLCRSGTGYRLSGSKSSGDSLALQEINAALAGWDGRREFSSDYLPCTERGEQQYLRLFLYPSVSRPGEFIGMVQDATQEFRRERRLQDALTLADSANRAKTRFLSSVSHDIRTPLNAIINMTRFLQNDLGDPQKATRQLQVIQQSSEHLLHLINNVLDLSRIESGKLSFTNAPFLMSEALNGVRSIVEPLCAAKRQTFRVSFSVQHPALNGDVLRLNQILINLLNNAVKFTPEGGSIDFAVTELPSIKPEELPFRFVVRDSGIGIPADKLSSIFDPFSRVDSRAVQETEGSGLGLAITKRFVDALGGSIRVESVVGQGSVFTVELTYAADVSGSLEPSLLSRGPVSRFTHTRALLAEDNAINVEIATILLGELGIEVESVGDGKQAAEKFAENPPGYYQVVYMDIQMPVMDGYEATRAIRAMERSDSQTVPIIAMTANAFAEDIERARSAGMNAHISKPVDPTELYRVTARVLR